MDPVELSSGVGLELSGGAWVNTSLVGSLTTSAGAPLSFPTISFVASSSVFANSVSTNDWESSESELENQSWNLSNQRQTAHRLLVHSQSEAVEWISGQLNSCYVPLQFTNSGEKTFCQNQHFI